MSSNSTNPPVEEEALREWCLIERWVDVPSFEGYYQVSNWGRVRSFDRRVRFGNQYRTVLGKILEYGRSRCGCYRMVTLNKNRTAKTIQVGRLVLLSFRGPCPPGYQVNHRDDNKENNYLYNVYYGTQAENVRDCIRNGKKPDKSGEKHPLARLTEKQVTRIRKRFYAGESVTNLSEEYGITSVGVWDMITGKLWKCVPLPSYPDYLEVVEKERQARKIRNHNNKLSLEQKLEMCIKFSQGYTLEHISNTFRIHIVTVRRWLRSNNVLPPKKPRPRRIRQCP